MSYPRRIICLTEESVETLYLLGKGHLIVGVSEYVQRPPEAQGLPVVCQFIKADVEKIIELRPDLILGFSDLQKDIARELISKGVNVFISNQRSLEEILDYILLLGRMTDAASEAIALVDQFRTKLNSLTFSHRPKVYFEEWDHPRLSAIRWVSELIEAAGGENIFKDKMGSSGPERKVGDELILERNPDFIFGCWCGKKVNLESIKNRPGYDQISAVKTGNVFELSPTIFLQPGPALFLEGLDILSRKLHP